MPQPEKPVSVILLCENESSANIDRRALRECGLTGVRAMTSGIEAARLLAGMDRIPGLEPDIVICQSKLADMDGEQFCAIIRQHPRLLGLPVLLILPNDSEAAQLRTLGCGASALLGRPYSVAALRSQLAQMLKAVPGQRKLREAAQQADTSAFDDALATYGLLLKSERQPEDYFKAGMRSLEENNWNLAIAAFERSLRDAHIKAEAELGIAAAYKGKGDMPRFRAWLARASETFVAAKRWNRARAAYARLLQHDPSAKNPFLAQAHQLIRERQYDEAAIVLVQSLNLLPKIKASERYARVCLSADEPEEMFSALEESLRQEGDHDFMASEIRESLTVMTRQREERQRQQAEERKWQLAQSLARRKQAEAAKAEEEKRKSREPAPVRAAPPLALDLEEPLAAGIDIPTEGVAPLILEPFGARHASDSGSGRKSGLNELFSVIKLTWNLARKSGKGA